MFSPNRKEEDDQVVDDNFEDDLKRFEESLNANWQEGLLLLQDDEDGVSLFSPPPKSGPRTIQQETKDEFSSFDEMERRLATEMLQDKLELKRGLRDIKRKQQHAYSYKRLTQEERMGALRYVKRRVQELRSKRYDEMIKKENIPAMKQSKTTRKSSKQQFVRPLGTHNTKA